MKKLLLILLCVPLIFSCGEKENNTEDILSKEITREMILDGYTGTGTYTWADGEKYVGEYKDGKMHGKGTYTYFNGTKYVGEYKDGKMHGKGTYTYFNAKYVGEYKDDKRNGQGTMTYTDGGKYIGEWKDGNKDGQGTRINSSGSKYVGEWKDDKENGQGTYTWQNPWEQYVGEVKDGTRHGQGTYTMADGTVEKGLWEDDEFLGEIEKDNIILIYPGYKGVLYKNLEGLDTETIYGEGEHIVNPGDRMAVYDVKPQTIDIREEGLDKIGITVGLEMNILYNPIPDEIGLLEDEIGTNYLNKVIKPKITEIVRAVINEYTYDEMYDFKYLGETTDKSRMIQDTIEKMMKEELLSYHINIEILILNVSIPKTIEDAIAEKVEAEQRILEMK
tara:strand:- start:38 stop:1207 length:1170 start_codon:yes stop_codon:yes gene_type:complete